MMHGREYSKRIWDVKPPHGSSVWTSGLPDRGACLAAAPVVAHRGSARVQDRADTPPDSPQAARSRSALIWDPPARPFDR
jgi:hypothetical protein